MFVLQCSIGYAEDLPTVLVHALARATLAPFQNPSPVCDWCGQPGCNSKVHALVGRPAAKATATLNANLTSARHAFVKGIVPTLPNDLPSSLRHSISASPLVDMVASTYQRIATGAGSSSPSSSPSPAPSSSASSSSSPSSSWAAAGDLSRHITRTGVLARDDLQCRLTQNPDLQ